MSWTTALQQVLAKRYDTVPAGWLTVVEISKEWDRGRSRTSDLLVLMVEAGKAERKTFKVMRNGVLRVVPYYRLK